MRGHLRATEVALDTLRRTVAAIAATGPAGQIIGACVTIAEQEYDRLRVEYSAERRGRAGQAIGVGWRALQRRNDADSPHGLLVAMLDAHDRDTARHSVRVGALAYTVAQRIAPQAADDAQLAGLLHDTGKLYVPAAVLQHPGRLGDTQRRWIAAHPVAGARVLERLDGVRHLTPVARWHHERVDGTGYPDGLAGPQIPVLARIVGVCDAYDAITSSRAHDPARSRHSALAELQAQAGTQFDATIVAALGDAIATHATSPPSY